MARKIVFASGKGGVGKSTIIANVSVGSAQLGADVVLVDADVAMADLALSLGLDVEGPTLHEVLAGEADLSDAIYPGPEGVKVATAGVSLYEVKKANPEMLENVVDELGGEHDLILIDSPSGLGKAALAALRACDELVLVTAPIITSLSDALRTKEVAKRLGKDPIGVVVSRAIDSELNVSVAEIRSTLELPILGVIPEDPEVPRSASVGNPVILRNPDSESAQAFKDLTWDILVENGDIDYHQIVNNPISKVKEIAQERNLNYSILKEVEKKEKNRDSLIEWFESMMDAEASS